jgi:metallo-beta-lactamase class B
MKYMVQASLLLGFMAIPAAAQNGQPTPNCSQCAGWNAPEKPFHIFGDTYYVGTAQLSSILVTSGEGDILIDGDLNESAPHIADHIKALGFKLSDIKLILNSHAHHDHAGGISQLQRLTGARVLASPWSAQVLRSGRDLKDDPQYGLFKSPMAKVVNVRVLKDGETVHVGTLTLTAHFTPGHTPGGTSWTWRSCENDRCLAMVYADSLTSVSVDNFHFSGSPAMAQFEKSFAVDRALPCDVLLMRHPGFSPVLGKMVKGEKPDLFVDKDACIKLAEDSRAALDKRLAQERAGK